MDLSSNLQKNIVGFGAVILTVVVLSIVLVNFKTNSVCPTGYEYNATASTTACVLSTNNSVASTSADTTILGTIDTSVTGFQEPGNWVDIVVISVVGIGILGLFLYLLKRKNS